MNSDALLGAFLRAPRELLAALAPNGWERSPLVHVYHPTAEQRREELNAFERTMSAFFGEKTKRKMTRDEPATDDIRPIEPEREVIDLVGRVLWDVFSDNNTAIDAAGAECVLGSFRGSADAIADAIDAHYPQLAFGYGYLDFYMGKIGTGSRADLTPVYRWVFEELRRAGCDWRHSFPGLDAISVGREPAPPSIVRAYREVFGRLPMGWPV